MKAKPGGDLDGLCRLVDDLGIDREFYPTQELLGRDVAADRVLRAWETLDPDTGPVGAYLHIPLCRSKCAYCHFPSHPPRPGEAGQVLEMLATELRLFRGSLRRLRFDTLYIGGGTPSLLSADEFHRLLDAVSWTIRLKPTAQVTVEVNPSFLDDDFACALALRGVDRVSLGVQSFDPGVLERVGRSCQTNENVRRAVTLLRQAGIGNLCLDLMAGLPGATADSFCESVRLAIELQPDTIHVYPFEARGSALHEQGWRQSPEDTKGIYQAIRLAEPVLIAAGYEKPLNESVYLRFTEKINRYDTDRYLRAGSVAGFGDHAYGHVFGRLHYGAVEARQRRSALGRGRLPPYLASPCNLDVEMREHLAYTLKHGIDREAFRRRFGRLIEEVFAEEIGTLQAAGWIDATADSIRPRFTSQREVVAASLLFFSRTAIDKLVGRGG